MQGLNRKTLWGIITANQARDLDPWRGLSQKWKPTDSTAHTTRKREKNLGEFPGKLET